METHIARNLNDIIQKYTSSLFKDTALLEFYGIKTARIKEIVNVELPKVEISMLSTDYVFLLDDESYLHLEFQSTASANDLTRFAMYDFQLYQRDSRRIKTVVIYTADVKEADRTLNMGSLRYEPDQVMMIEYDGNTIFSELENKINANRELTDIDMMNLIFVPLMKNSIPKMELAIKSLELAQNIKDQHKRHTCLATVYAFATKYLDNDGEAQLLEVLKMSDLLVKYVEEEFHKGEISGVLKVAKKLLQMGQSVEEVVKATELDKTQIEKLKEELSKQ